ncbi:uncharacterized protein LOC111525117 [Piliocolobus tephrosceles]|uniref:uncharacterized protein LOC111525117 n=1 Tax=Piliocolobus tephrosceles TaxID=591936 RepID=UPI000C2A5947|nr:uncharacterized protein LOC111525117 [Piliocolobus tephrosceles]
MESTREADPQQCDSGKLGATKRLEVILVEDNTLPLGILTSTPKKDCFCHLHQLLSPGKITMMHSKGMPCTPQDLKQENELKKTPENELTTYSGQWLSMPARRFLDTLAEDDFLGTLLRVNVISKFPKQHPLDKSLLTYALPRPPTKGDGHKEVDLLSWCHSFYCQLHQNNDTVFLMHGDSSLSCVAVDTSCR